MRLFWNNRENTLSVAWCMNSLAYSIVYPFIPLYMHGNRGFSMALVGFVFLLMGVGSMAGPPIAGVLVDKFGCRRVLFHGQIWRGLVFVVLTVMVMVDAPFHMFAVFLMLNSCVGTFFQNASDAYLTHITTLENRSRAYSKIRVGTNVGWAVGPMMGAFLATTPFSLLFALTALLCVFCAWFVWRACPDARPREEREGASRIGGAGDGFSWVRIVRDRPFVATSTLGFTLFLLVSQLYATLSVHATEVVGVTKNALGFMYSINGLTIILLQIPLTRLLDWFRMDFYLRLLCGSAFYAAGYFSVAFAGACWHLMVSVAVLTLGEIMVQPALYAVISRMAPGGAIGRYMGVLGLMRGLAYSIGPYIGSLLFVKYSAAPATLWGILACFGVAAAFGFGCLWRLGRVR